MTKAEQAELLRQMVDTVGKAGQRASPTPLSTAAPGKPLRSQ